MKKADHPKFINRTVTDLLHPAILPHHHAGYFIGALDMRDVEALDAPKRIECFDISHIQGTDKVASMVVWEDCRMKKVGYGPVDELWVIGLLHLFGSC